MLIMRTHWRGMGTNQTTKREIQKILIEIHHENGFLGGEIRFRISRSTGKLDLDFENLNPDFPIGRTP